MAESVPTVPDDSGAPRRGLFARRHETSSPAELGADDPVRVVSLDQAVEIRLEEGLHRIEDQTAALMREVASEMWRGSGADAGLEQDRIINFLSRDQAIRSLIASSDERFQTIAVRTARLEDSLSELAESTRAVREAIQLSADAIREIANSPTLHGVEAVRTELEQVERHIAATFTTLQARDQLLTDGIQTRVREHGELIANETARIVEAMEGYVQAGAEAVGRLAQRMEEHAVTFTTQDQLISEHMREAVASHVGPVSEQLELLYERVGIQARALESLQTGLDAMAHDRTSGIAEVLEERTMGLAKLVRSDSQALHGLIEERMAQQAAVFEETLATVTTAAIERSMVQLMENLDVKLEERLLGIAEVVAERVAARATDTVGAAVAAGIEQTVDQLRTSVGAIDGIDTMMAESQQATEERLMVHMDDRMTAIAKLIRSDNQALASKLETSTAGSTQAAGGLSEADSESLRQTLRAVKELEAGLASDMLGTMDRRFQTVSDQLHNESQSTAESMIKVAEVIGEKIDRLSVRIDEGYGSDIQVVVDRMGDAIRALSRTSRLDMD
ncbi:MAG: hypothetical protein QOE83_560 [Actinomycetota bacterium]|jgi:hypothetical protein|nr:hypothetical protein [Actinomycetota bacterium]